MADDDDLKPPYEVGYRNPPQQTQFVKGKSGNPKGRPKGSRNFATVIQDELKRRVAVTEDGKRKRITKREAVAKQLVNKAAAGDPRAIPILLNETRPHEIDAAADASRAEMMSPEDQAVMESIARRIREAANPSDAASSSEQSTATSTEAAPPDNQEETPQ
jgi:Family of unknown function (DUF5681)